jgi:hypothetical protein
MQLPEGWHNDQMIRDEVHIRVRGLIREGYTSAEIVERVGCTPDVVTKQRKVLGIRSYGAPGSRANR